MADALEIDSINKSFNGKTILSDVYLKCETGDIIGIFGRNGSGKSTLLKIIYGILDAEYKFVRLNNKVLKKAYILKNGLAFLPQNSFIPSNLIVLNAIFITIVPSKHADFIDDELLKPILKSKIRSLSGGELKYLEVKLILFSEAKFCLLDEPYSGISPIFVEKINFLIAKQAQNKGIIITDHQYQYLLNVATKIYLIKDRVGKFLNNKQDLVRCGYLNQEMLNEN